MVLAPPLYIRAPLIMTVRPQSRFNTPTECLAGNSSKSIATFSVGSEYTPTSRKVKHSSTFVSINIVLSNMHARLKYSGGSFCLLKNSTRKKCARMIQFVDLINMQPKQISFPNDHQAHDSVIEWWYFNGHLADDDGNRYGYMDCFFKADIEKVGIPHLKGLPLQKIFGRERYVYFAHSILSDIRYDKNWKEVQNISIVSNDSFQGDRLFIDYTDPIMLSGFVNNEIDEVGVDAFHLKTATLDLTLKSKKPALLEGGKGYISASDMSSYYYSLTDMETTGSITIDGKKINVKGKSWMDHQWADVSYKQDKWTWFSIMLEDGTDIMCCEYDDGVKKDYLASVITSSYKTFHYKKLGLVPGSDIWKSKTTKAEYPMSWDIIVPEHDAKLHVKSLVTDQEMVFMAINYWEGPIEVSGTIGGKAVKGVGFMELVGYPSDYNYMVTSGKEIAKKIEDALLRMKSPK